MSVVINTNVDSLKIQNCLTSATSKMASVMQRMSTGLKVNSAKDDAAGCVIAAKMQVQLDGNSIAQNNVQNANTMLSTVEGNLDVVADNLIRIRDLALEAKNGTYSATEKTAMQDEVAQRADEISRISKSAKYSGTSLFEDAILKANGISFQVGADADENNVISIANSSKVFDSVKFSSLVGLTGSQTVAANFNIGNMTSAQLSEAITKLDNAIENINKRKATIGAVGNRLDSALSTLATQYENLSSAKSVITDADIASEASKYTQESILQQVSTSLLAQANQSPAIALSLI